MPRGYQSTSCGCYLHETTRTNAPLPERRCQPQSVNRRMCSCALRRIGAEIEKSASVDWSGGISIRAQEMNAAAGKADGSSEARQLVEPAWVRIGVHKDNRPAHPARTELCDELLDKSRHPRTTGSQPKFIKPLQYPPVETIPASLSAMPLTPSYLGGRKHLFPAGFGVVGLASSLSSSICCEVVNNSRDVDDWPTAPVNTFRLCLLYPFKLALAPQIGFELRGMPCRRRCRDQWQFGGLRRDALCLSFGSL